ncbi:MAG: DNA gyrase subunit A, partial [Chloroflexi bacterium]|nr:DNA gyrase subunit A [Chloroflexota bacterium]
ILFFSNRGKVYSEKTYRIPEASRTAKGSSIFNLLNLEPEETITAALRVKDFKNSEYCILATRNGKTKRVALSEFSSVRPSGLIAMNLNDDDELGWVQLTSGEDEIIFVSENGQALRFKEDSVRAMGRQAAGVKGINLRGDDKVTSMEVLREGYDLLIITTNGYGKRTPLDQYNAKGRATMGVKTIDTNAIHIVGKIAGAKVVKPSDNLTIISSNGVVLRTKVEDIKQAGRATRGVKVINLGEGDSVASTARMAEESIEDITEESNEEDSDAKEKDANDLKE